MGVNDSRIAMVMAASHCRTHRAEVNEACWLLPAKDGQRDSRAVCGARIKRAGFNGGNAAFANQKTPSGTFK